MSNTIEIDGLVYGEHMIRELREQLAASQQETERLRVLLGEAIGIARRRGAAIEYLERQVDGYDVIKEVADEIVHGIVDARGGARIDGATVLPNADNELKRIAKEGGVEQ